MKPQTRQRRVFVAVLLVSAAGFFSGVARGNGSSPVLAITGAGALAAAGGTRMVRVAGTFNFDDLLQLSFPAGVVIMQGAQFARYDVSGQTVAGTSPAVAAAIAAGDAPTLLTLGTVASPPARLTRIRPSEISVVLPAGFTSGTASVILYAFFDDGSFFSNSVAVTLP